MPNCERCGTEIRDENAVETDAGRLCTRCADRDTDATGGSAPTPESPDFGADDDVTLALAGTGTLGIVLMMVGFAAGPPLLRIAVGGGFLVTVVGSVSLLCRWRAAQTSGPVSLWAKTGCFSAGLVGVSVVIAFLGQGIHEVGWSPGVAMVFLLAGFAAVVGSPTAFACWWVWDRY